VRFTILNLIVVTTVVAVVVAFDLHGPLLTILFPIIVFVLFPGLCLHLVYRLQMFAANRLTPFYYSHRIFPVLESLCGSKYSARALCNYAAKLSATGQHEDAIKALNRAIRLDASSADYWANRGAAYYNAGDSEKAYDDLNRAVTLASNPDIARAYRGCVSVALGKCREGIDDLQQIQCERNEHYFIALSRGHAHEQLHEWSIAVQDYLLAHELNPSEITAAISLARLQAGCPDDEIRNGAKAVENAHRMCVRTGWKDWIAISVLAAGHAEQGDFETAVAFAKQAHDLAPDTEKQVRKQRIRQFEHRIPFRIQE
jgi:tetratricopeptide (TPR) repeat protein